jgi:hypothetical protein
MTDLVPGYFLELWIPANLQHDLFELATEIAVTGTDRQHALVTNGAAEEIGTNAWRVTFEPPVNASSPLWALLPADTLDARATPIRLPDGHTVTVESYAELAPGEPDADLELVEAMVSSALHETNLELGDYLHGDRIVVFASHGGMEYDGATFAFPSDFVLRHEVFHSWIGRGLRPLTGRDAWFDEAWTSFAMDWNYAYETVLGPTDRPPPALAPDTPWLRATPTAAYSRGAAVLHTIASEVGISELRGLLREFYVSGTADAFVTTEQLELFLWCNTSGPIVRTTFHNHVYGKAGEPSPLDPADCG